MPPQDGPERGGTDESHRPKPPVAALKFYIPVDHHLVSSTGRGYKAQISALKSFINYCAHTEIMFLVWVSNGLLSVQRGGIHQRYIFEYEEGGPYANIGRITTTGCS